MAYGGRSCSQLDLNQWRVHPLLPSISMEKEREKEIETQEREKEVIVNDAFGLGNKRGKLRLDKKTKSEELEVPFMFALNNVTLDLVFNK